MRRSTLMVMGLAAMLLSYSCHRTPAEAVQIHRFDKVLFETRIKQLQDEIQYYEAEMKHPWRKWFRVKTYKKIT